MGIASIPSAGGGGIKSVQRGSAGGSGTVTITAVDISKSFVNIFGTSSSGTVSASFGLNATNFNYVGTSTRRDTNFYGAHYQPNTRASNQTAGNFGNDGTNNSFWNYSVAVNAANVNAGSNNLVAAVVQGYLSNSTSLVVSGACRYEVVEFN